MKNSALTAMYHFAKFLEEKSGCEVGVIDPAKFFSGRQWKGRRSRSTYEQTLVNYIANMSESADFGRWVREWNESPRNTSTKKYSVQEWREYLGQLL